jgi:hypothetical protein
MDRVTWLTGRFDGDFVEVSKQDPYHVQMCRVLLV